MIDRGLGGRAQAAPSSYFTDAHVEALLTLLRVRTVSPLESDRLPSLREAQELYAAYASRLGFDVVYHEVPPASWVDDARTPSVVQGAYARLGQSLLDSQPNLVLRLGPGRGVGETVMFNVHLDTVGDELLVERDGSVVKGRGAVDAKGPAVALLAGIEAAMAEDSTLLDRITVLIQAVGGEEGGSMGALGTRVVINEGFVGRLNVFCEPTDHRYLTASPATMTACVEVEGRTSTDDRAEDGDNATVILAYVTQALAQRFVPLVASKARVCIAGLTTGAAHNRVYGTGRLLVNMAYASERDAQAVEHDFTKCVDDALAEFTELFARIPTFARSATSAKQIVRLRWLKRGMPVLTKRGDALEAVLQRAGIECGDGSSPFTNLTCDGIWAGIPGTLGVVYGPGELVRNDAHGDGEFVHLDDLSRYALGVAALLREFGGPRKDR